MKHITSRVNPDFKALQALGASGRDQRKHGLTLLEGSHLVTAYHSKVGAPERLIVSDQALGRSEIAQLVKTLAGTDTLCLTDRLFGEISDLATPSGIAAVIKIPALAANVARVGSTVLLDAVQDAGNVGSVLRTAAAAGIVDVFLGPGCAGAWTPRVLRAAQGAHFDLRVHERADLISVMEAFSGMTLAATVRAGDNLYDLDLGGDVAWLFGNEGAGVSQAHAARATRRVVIPMASGSESLNVAAAAAICIFEEARQKLRMSARGRVRGVTP